MLKQKIIGAKQHGFARSFYRTYPHVSSGTNIAIQVLESEITKRMEHCKKTNTLMPQVLYLQIDGGPENTSNRCIIPNRENKIELPGIYTKDSIYTIYHKHVTKAFAGDEHEPLSLSAFKRIWKNIFPNVTITKFCQVTGKCITCHSLYERQEIFRSERDLDSINFLPTSIKL